MVDVDWGGEVVGSDDEGEVVGQDATSRSGDDGSLYVLSQNGGVLQSRQGSFLAPDPAQVSVLVHHNFGGYPSLKPNCRSVSTSARKSTQRIRPN